MKCDELTAYNVVATADVNPEVVDSLGCTEWAGYDKDKVDEAIAELKLKLESVQASMYADVVDANMEVRRLKRALFIAHAIKAKFKWWWMSECKHNESCKLLPDTREIKKFTNCAWICSKSQDKCRAKAEEYK